MQDLDSTTRERLADLRRLLRDAQARSSDRTSAGQHTAIVLLDAACEHAAGLVIGHFGLAIGKNFEATMSCVRDQLPKWRPQAWKGVRDLHRQRNQAQHHGIRPDPHDVTRWASDAETFVETLVYAAFGVELPEIMVADAIEQPEARRHLRAAEQALDREDYAEAKYSAVDAFEAARASRRRGRSNWGVPWYDRREENMPEGVLADLERLREQAEIQPFASDYGEYLWLASQHRRYARSAPVPAEDALRALAFVTEWILRWEHFSRRNINREDEWMVSTPPATSGVPDAKPSIRGIDVVVAEEAEFTDPPEVRLVVTVQDLPLRHRQQWAFEFGQAVTSHQLRYGGRGGASCDVRGVLSVPLTAEIARPELIPDVLEHSLAEALEKWRAWCAAEEERERAAVALMASTRDALAPWIGSVLESVDFAHERRDLVRLRFRDRLNARERYWTEEWLRRRFGENDQAHRITVDEEWAEVPAPVHDDTVGAIVADVMRERESRDATFASTRASLEAFAKRAAAELGGHFTSG